LIPILFLYESNYRSFLKENNSNNNFNKYYRIILIFLFSIILIIVLLFFNFSSINEFDNFNEKKSNFTILNYDIQNGYDQNGNKNYDEVLNAIKFSNPDFISLQRSTTMRISNNNDDILKYISNRLNYTYINYGPKRF
jgi:hypothetical protein